VKLPSSNFSLVLLFCLFFLSTSLTIAQQKKYNILFIVVDDLRPELACYGSTRVLSPNIDKLAQKSSLFSQAYCNAAVCGPSRASLMTGIRPRPGKIFKSWNSRIDKEAPGILSIAEYLKTIGYRTYSYGKVMHHQDDSPQAWTVPSWRSNLNREAGFHFYNEDNDWLNPASASLVKDKKGPFFEAADVADTSYHDGQLTRKAISELNELHNKKEPFFMAIGFWRPHLPFNAPKKYWDLYDPQKINLATNRFRPKNAPESLQSSKEILGQYTANYGFPDDSIFHSKALHAYLASVSYIDTQIGLLTATLEEKGMFKNTIIVLLGDHGFHLGEHNFWGKHNTLDISTKAPLIIYHPSYKAKSIHQNIEFVDIYPTLCEMLKINIPSHCEGKSLVPIIKNPKLKHKDFIFTQHDKAIAVKHQNLMFTQWLDSNDEMLFDHVTDPQENQNHSTNPTYALKKARLEKALADWKKTW
jgi:iduronate 2-sulfatase